MRSALPTILALAMTLGACAPLPPTGAASFSTSSHPDPALDRVTWAGGGATLERDAHGSSYLLRASNGAEAILSSRFRPPRFDDHAVVQGRPVVVVSAHDNPDCPNALTLYLLNGRFWEPHQLGNCTTTVTYQATPDGLTIREQIRPNRNHTVWTIANGTWVGGQSEYTSAAELNAMNAQAHANALAQAAAAVPVRPTARAHLQTPSAVSSTGASTVDARRYQVAPGHLTLDGTP